MQIVAPLFQIALLGNPNCGKTALFNLLTGSHQKVANYAGVTVERKLGTLHTPQGRPVRVIDLPGAYSLDATSADEAVTRDVVIGARQDEPRPDLIVCVVDATRLRQNLRLVLEARQLGLPMLLALNLSDVAAERGIHIDVAALSRELGMPVVETIAVRQGGAAALLQQMDEYLTHPLADSSAAQSDGTRPPSLARPVTHWTTPTLDELMDTHQAVRRVLDAAVREPVVDTRRDDLIDRVVLHPFWGYVVLAGVLFLMFQAVFSWAKAPMDGIKAGIEALGGLISAHMDDGPLRSLLVEGVLAGAGGVLVFLPQILILFFFILALEDSGYLPRAAFMLDRVMAGVGLTGRSFIPLLSSFACAVPGIMATRTITGWRDRLITIMIAPLMTCSARLPVYALLIGAFIPAKAVAGVFNLQGLVLFILYVAGIVSALAVAWVMRHWRRSDADANAPSLLLELPSYRLPHARNLVIGLWERARIFVGRVGTIILSLSIVLWFLSTYPAAPADAVGAAIQYSAAGRLGQWLQPLVAPIGFNWQIAIALIPGMAAREVAVGALGTVYALSATNDQVAEQLSPMIAHGWSVATACSLLAWYVFAPQCISTFAAIRRETNSWRYPLLMTGYLFALAYLASWITYRLMLGVTL